MRVARHVFVATGANAAVTVAGLIDFGDACGGRPLDDTAEFCRDWPMWIGPRWPHGPAGRPGPHLIMPPNGPVGSIT